MPTTTKGPQVTAAQFEANPRAKAIRDVCLTIADATYRLLYKRDVVEADEYALIEQMNGKLIELGITSNMRLHLEASAYDDPITMAEWEAGQTMKESSKHIVAASNIVPVVQEFSEKSIGPAHILSGKNMPSQLVNSLVALQCNASTYHFLDAKFGDGTK